MWWLVGCTKPLVPGLVATGLRAYAAVAVSFYAMIYKALVYRTFVADEVLFYHAVALMRSHVFGQAIHEHTSNAYKSLTASVIAACVTTRPAS